MRQADNVERAGRADAAAGHRDNAWFARITSLAVSLALAGGVCSVLVAQQLGETSPMHPSGLAWAVACGLAFVVTLLLVLIAETLCHWLDIGKGLVYFYGMWLPCWTVWALLERFPFLHWIGLN
jgi:hypothetical protein